MEGVQRYFYVISRRREISLKSIQLKMCRKVHFVHWRRIQFNTFSSRLDLRPKNNGNESLYRLPEKDPLSPEVLEFVFLRQIIAWRLQTGKTDTTLKRYINLWMRP